MSDSPYAKVRVGPNKTVYKHRLEYEKEHGKLKPGQIVHHKDNNGYNNKLSNLEATTISKNKKESDKFYKNKRKK
jgi:hypothetical protein